VIVIGLGSGRCGTATLATLLDRQPDARCFHEANAVAVRFTGTLRPCLNTVEEFAAILAGGDPSMMTVDLSRPSVAAVYDRLAAMNRPRLLGDVGYYYLHYVDSIAARHPQARFVCMRRDRAETIESWVDKTKVHHSRRPRFADRIASLIKGEPFTDSRNFWMAHDGTRWRLDPVWDKTFPKFDASSMEEAIGMYWDDYYRIASRLQAKLPERFRIFDISTLNTEAGQQDLLGFCGISADLQTYSKARANVEKPTRRAA
jgi:hypothetical protein